ncbi:MAG: hypothetical protein GXW99_06960 [Clostridiales bacterium]|nr:hypothetical protein [Clostridiales bacterium]
MENKTCPMLTIAACTTGIKTAINCTGDACAWWVPEINGIHNNAPGYCAMLDLRALPRIREAVRKI